MRGFAHVLCVVALAVGGWLSACSAQEGVLLHIELTSDPTLPTIQHLELYVGHQVQDGSAFPGFAPGGPTFEREAGDDVFLLTEYNVDSAFDLMLPSATLPLWPEWRQVLVVGSIKAADGSWQPVAWGASKVGGTKGRVNRYDIILRALDDKFTTAPGCVAWNAGLVIDVGARCPGPVCVPQTPMGVPDKLCDAIDADCNGVPAVVDHACMRVYPNSNGGRFCNLINRATCTELETKDESYLCATGDIAETTCLSIDHCNGADADGRYTDLMTMQEPVANVLQKIDAKCEIPVDEQGVPCGAPAKRLKFTLGSDVSTCIARFGDRFVDPSYDSIGVWSVQPAMPQGLPQCEGHFELFAPQGGGLTQGAVLLGVRRLPDLLKVGFVVEIKPKLVAVDGSGQCMNPLAPATCAIATVPTACFQQ